MRIDRLRLDRSQVERPIPSISDRQFVISRHSLSPSEESLLRQLFWYREEILNRLKVTWREVGSHRRGEVNLRTLRLSKPMLDVLRAEEVEVVLSLETRGGQGKKAERTSVQMPRYRVDSNVYVDLVVSVTNSTRSSPSHLSRNHLRCL